MPSTHSESQSVIDGLGAWLSHWWFILAALAAGAARVENFGVRLKRTEEDRKILELLVKGQSETNERLARIEGRIEGQMEGRK
jgi:hypothetical protein